MEDAGSGKGERQVSGPYTFFSGSFFFILMSCIFYCFCSFLCDYSAFYHLLIRENSKEEGVLLCKSWLWRGTILPLRSPETLPLAPHLHLAVTPDLQHLAQLAEHSFWDFKSQTVRQRQRK